MVGNRRHSSSKLNAIVDVSVVRFPTVYTNLNNYYKPSTAQQMYNAAENVSFGSCEYTMLCRNLLNPIHERETRHTNMTRLSTRQSIEPTTSKTRSPRSTALPVSMYQSAAACSDRASYVRCAAQCNSQTPMKLMRTTKVCGKDTFDPSRFPFPNLNV